MAKRLTEKAVKRLGAKRAAYWIWDSLATGLGLKVTPVGAKIWVMQLRYPGHPAQSRRTLGKYPSLDLAAARAKAQAWYAWVKQGIDPADAEAAERERREVNRRAETLKRENTFASVAERFIAERASNRRALVDAREIHRLLVAQWGEYPIHKIAPRDVRQLIDHIKLRAPYDARNAWTHAVGIFKMAVHNELITASPCASLDKKLLFKNLKLEPRQRTLDDSEIAAFWTASGRLGYPYGLFYRLLLLTGVRVNELAQAQWSEVHPELRRLLREAKAGKPVDWSAVDDSVKLWTIPRERFKSDAEHIVPLSDDALALLESLPRFAGCDFLFTATGNKPINDRHRAKARLDAFMIEALREAACQRGDDPNVKLVPWVNHDLRRVLRTNLSALDVADHIAEICLGHGRKGLQRVYDQHRYLDQQRDAFARWAARLRTIVGPQPTPDRPPNVVSLRRAQ
ncbi:MAG: tyrosine-type recombinase/integrase [Xanthobacteraceae bacterium]